MHSAQKTPIRKKITDFTAPDCKYWILDTDIGGDDAQALISLIYLAKKHNKIILGITCVNGNIYLKDVMINTLIVLAQCEVKIPVYAGCEKALVNTDVKDFYFGKDGFGNHQVSYLKQISDKIDFTLIQKQHASQFICEAARKYPKEIGLLVIGPLTNIALAYYLDQKLVENVEMVSCMGGNFTGFGLQRFFSAEFNFHSDAEATYVVLKKFRNVYLSTFETALDCQTKKMTETLLKDSTPKAKLVKDVYGLLTKADINACLVCDPLAAFVAINAKEYVTGVYQVNCEVVLSGKRTKGMLTVDWFNDVSDKEVKDGVIRIISHLDMDKIYDGIMESYD